MTLTREECAEAISHPGKFEACPIYAPYFYELSLDGGGDDDFMNANGNTVDIIIVSSADRVHFNSSDAAEDSPLRGVYAVAIWSDDYGFIYCIPFSDAAEMSQFAFDNHGHEFGEVETSRLTGSPHRKCQIAGCKQISLDLDDDFEVNS